MGTKVYNKLPGYIKEIDSYKAFKKELKLFLLLHTFYSGRICNYVTYNILILLNFYVYNAL